MFTATGVTSDELKARGRKVVRRAGKQILLIASGGRIFAIANRCPHEGYPLSEGTEGPDCVLTCNWHNWKFDLANGEALVGRDPVRTYPVELRNGEIFLDLADPPADGAEGARAQGPRRRARRQRHAAHGARGRAAGAAGFDARRRAGSCASCARRPSGKRHDPRACRGGRLAGAGRTRASG